MHNRVRLSEPQRPWRGVGWAGVATACVAAALAASISTSVSRGAAGPEPEVNAKGVISFFGNSSSSSSVLGGEFSTTGGVAVNATGAGGVAAGDVYVVDRGNNRVDEFSALGSFVRVFGKNVGPGGKDVCEAGEAASCLAGTASAEAGGLNKPQGVAVEQATGNVYVTDETNRRVDVFSATGVFEGAFGWDVNNASAKEELQFCTTATQCKAGSSGAGAGQFATSFFGSNFIGYLTAAPVGTSDPEAGNVLVANAFEKRIDEFKPTLTGSTVTGISYVRGVGWQVNAANPKGELQECTVASKCQTGATGAGVGEFGSSGPTRVAVSPTGVIYAVDPSNFRVQQFTPPGGGGALTASTFAASTLTGTTMGSTPSDVAVDSDSGEVYVVKTYGKGIGTPPAGVAEERRVLRLSPANELLEVDLADAEITTANGLAENPINGRLYLSSTTGAQRVYVLGVVVPPSAAMASSEPVTSIAAHEATLYGTVDPDGGVATGYHFEYRQGEEGGWTPIGSGGQAGDGETEVQVTEKLSGIEADTTYQVRLTATKAYNGPSASSPPITFTTPAIAPEVSVEAPSYSSTLARLRGTVNANNLPTTYTFEWGEGESYGQSSPATETSVGAKGTVVSVSRVITGLAPGVTYHYRLTATNAKGRSITSDESFTTLTPLPEGRAYEMVSPSDTQGIGVSGQSAAPIVVAPEGEAVLYGSKGAFAEPANDAGSTVNPYLAQRGSAGWISYQIYPPQSLIGRSPTHADASAGLSTVVGCGDAASDERVVNNVVTSDSAACALRKQDGSWLPSHVYRTINGAIFRTSPVENVQLGESKSLSDVVFMVQNGTVRLLPSDASTFHGGGGGSIYEVEGLGSPSTVLRQVNINSSGETIGPAGPVALGGFTQAPMCSSGSEDTVSDYQAVSAGGGTIFFSACPTANGAEQIYARIDGSQTVDVSNPSPPECATCEAAPESALYWGASRDGSKVFFTTTQQLADGDIDHTSDLYMYDFERTPHLVELSAGRAGDLTIGSGANVLGVLRSSSDGSHVYFVATGVLTTVPNSVSQSAIAGADNLYGVDTETGETRFVATLSPRDEALWKGEAEVTRPSQTTLNGGYLVFASYAKLITNGPEAVTSEASHVYRYDFQTGRLVRISIGEPGFPVSGNGNGGVDATIAGPSFLGTTYQWGAQADANDFERAISADGRTIVFSSAEQLQADDVNKASDVYEWHECAEGACTDGMAGEVHMISDGQDPEGVSSTSVGMSEDGSNIFFTTNTPLAAQDTGLEDDVYDARIGGGFSESAPAEPCTDSESCRGQTARLPSFTESLSEAFTGGMNLVPTAEVKPGEEHKKKHRKKLTRKQKLARALRACKHKPKRRTACQRKARKQYGATTKVNAKSTKRSTATGSGRASK